MSSSNVNPTDVELSDLFTDGYENIKQTDVYGNGKMQTVVFPSVNYNGSASIEDVRAFIQEKVVIYATNANGTGEGEPIPYLQVTGQNEYLTDIYRSVSFPTASDATAPTASDGVITDVRAPLYFFLDQGTYGQLKWYARIEETNQSTFNSGFVTVNSIHFSITPDDIEIYDYHKYAEGNVVRVMRYNYSSGRVSNINKLVKFWSSGGIKLDYSVTTCETRTNCYIGMLRAGDSSETKLSAIPSYKQLQIIIGGSTSQKLVYNAPYGFGYNPANYTPPYPDGACMTNASNWSECELIPSSVLERAWGEGIVMLLYWKNNLRIYNSNYTPPDQELQFQNAKFKTEDNFGNWTEIDLDWDYTQKDFRDWKVISTRAAN